MVEDSFSFAEKVRGCDQNLHNQVQVKFIRGLSDHEHPFKRIH